MVRRHRLIETFLVRELGYGWDEVHDEAEVLEHAVSDLLVERLAARLGQPDARPARRPDPDRRRARSRCSPRGRCGTSSAGRWVVARISDADPGRCATSPSSGSDVDMPVEVSSAATASSGSRVAGTGRALDAAGGAAVWLEPGRGRPGRAAVSVVADPGALDGAARTRVESIRRRPVCASP